MAYLKEKLPKTRKKWTSLLKTLLLIDYLLEESPLIEPLNEILLENPVINPYKPSEKDFLTSSFYQYIKLKGFIYITQTFRLSKYKEIKPLEPDFDIIIPLETLQDKAFCTIKVIEQGLLKTIVGQKLLEGILECLEGSFLIENDLLMVFSQRFFSYDLEKAVKIRDFCEKFIKNKEKLTTFKSRNQLIKGFQIKSPDLSVFQPQNDLLTAFNGYILTLQGDKGVFPNNNLENEIYPFEKALDCDIVDSDRENDIQRKKEIFISPIKAQFMSNIGEKSYHSDLKEEKPFKYNENLSYKNKFKFNEEKEPFCNELFEKFENTYSIKGLIDVKNAELQDFELQVKFNRLEKSIFRSQTLDLRDNVEFLHNKAFNEKLWIGYKSSYSKDFIIKKKEA